MRGMGNAGALKRGMEGMHFRSGRRREALCFTALCMFCLVAVDSATQGDDYLNEKEGQLAKIADAVQNNDVQKCELLKTCASAPCSRNTCFPGKDDVANYLCMHVSFNKYCNASAPGCNDKYFDYTRSFVRTAINTDFSSTLTTIGTCAQRALDPVFQNVSTPTSLLRIYFGATDGSWRGFPGSDQDVNDPECGVVKYDTRLRPWYRASTSVPRVIAILIDAGQSMNRDILPGQGSGTVLENAITIVGEFLKALSSGDFVNIIMFDSTKVTPLSPSMVQVQVDPITSLPELNTLTQNLGKQKSGDLPGTSDVVQGIDAALQNFAANYPDAAKIILVFTDGEFATGNISIPVTNLTSSNVKMFVYKIPPINDDNLFIANTPFASQLCSIGGSFEIISKLSGLSNPILALNTFFTFSANLHAKVSNNSADYSPIYAGYEQIEGNITTVSRPVFGADKTLLGVVGMDIFINNLGSLADSVYAAILLRSVGKGFKSSNLVLTSANCSLQTVLPSAEPCEASVTKIPNGGFCYRTDKSSTIKDLACCRSCAQPLHGSGGTSKSTVIGAAVGGTGGGILLFALLAWLLFKCLKKKKSKDGKKDEDFKFGGADDAPPVQLTGNNNNRSGL
ncbi:hypothetical protein M758_9G112000 [Ceratodon purpureus]|nr:hypothetical protein M758_9G112000 [Ceratodon purpureus]